MHVVIIGAGINGVTAAVELARRKHRVTVLDPGPIPHPLAASTDISKVVRMEYGSDEDYMALCERALDGWRRWNQEWGTDLFHETGVLFMSMREIKRGTFEYESFRLLKARNHRPQRIDSAALRQRFPAWNFRRYVDGLYNPEGGFAESGRVVVRLAEIARAMGVQVRENEAFEELDERRGKVQGIVTRQGRRISADRVVVAAGAWTHYILPHLKPYFRSSGMPVFHLKPREPDLFRPTVFPVFGADISTTGYYGFPLNRDGVVKIARHSVGRVLEPESPARVVTPAEERHFREFLEATFPALAHAPIVYRRVCLYSDTWDGHFWIAPDPDHPGLVVAAGDSGHGFKFAPVLGEIIADIVEDKTNPLRKKFRWRPKVHPPQGEEEARHKGAKSSALLAQ